MKEKTKTERAKGSEVGANDGDILPKTDSKGNVTSAEITIYNGNYTISPHGNADRRTEKQFTHHVLAEELKHIEGGKVHSEAEVDHGD